MRKQWGMLLIAVVPVALWAPAARAEVVFGGAVGSGQVEEGRFDGSDSAYKLFAGFRWFRVVGVELQYADFGEPDDSGVEVDTRAAGLFLVGAVPLGRWELFGKVGYAYWDANVTGSSPIADDNGADFAYGIGAAVSFAHFFSIRAEFERYDADGFDDVTFTSVGVAIRL
ncbi:MAG: outer membrane beta-barrel protein [Acidobacteriota bacterium]